MNRRVIFRAQARQDAANAYRWYEDQQPGLGAAFLEELDKTERLIGANPELFGRIRGEIRRAILHRFPYGVFYVVRPEFISVIAVLHHARDPRSWQRRSHHRTAPD